LGAVAILLAAIAVPLAGAATTSAGKGQVGGPPTLPLGPADEGKKITPALVIGRGRAYDGPVEIVAYGWRPPEDALSEGKEYCVWIEYPPDDIEYGTCASPLEPLEGSGAIQVDSEVQLLTPKRLRWTNIGGRLTPDVATVRVFFHRHGSEKRFHLKATVAQVGGRLQQRLDQPAPFGYFNVKVRGLVPFRSFRVQALDAGGQVIGSAHPFRPSRAGRLGRESSFLRPLGHNWSRPSGRNWSRAQTSSR